MMTNLCFNSVPIELVGDSTGDSKLTPKVREERQRPRERERDERDESYNVLKERVSILIDQLRKFGVAEKLLFTAEDLLEKRNIPKVARCLATCVDLVRLSVIFRDY